MTQSRIQREQNTVELMIRLYCRKKEGNRQLCESCRQLILYSKARLDHCPFGENKSTCKTCPVHCYKPRMRDMMRDVMRYSGPRMILYHPIAAILHLLEELF